jgi:hypothetical protein
MKPDWLKLERHIRDALRGYARGEVLGTQVCRIIDEALAAVTGRGNELPHDALLWESDSELTDTIATRDAVWK